MHNESLHLLTQSLAKLSERNEVDAEISELGEVKQGFQVTIVVQINLQVMIHVPRGE
jgi:hypothetical protein